MIQKPTWKLFVLLASFALAAWRLDAANGELTGGITGVVKDRSGEPASGAFVKAANPQRRLTFLVVSQDRGEFRLPDLPPGKYSLQAIGGDFETESPASVILALGQKASVNLTLDAKRPDEPAPFTDADYNKFLPETPGKAILKRNCTACHDLQQPGRHRGDPENWKKLVSVMLSHRAELGLKRPPDEDVVTLENYLAENLGPDVPSVIPQPLMTSQLPRHLVTGAGAKYRVVEYALPAGVAPHDVTADSQGIAWVCERFGGNIGRFDPATLTYTRIPVPGASDPDSGSMLNGIEMDPKGNVWFSDGGPANRLIRYDPKTEKFTSFQMPPPASTFNTLRFLPDGSVWGTKESADALIRLDPATGKVDVHHVPAGARTKETIGASAAYGLAVDGNGMLWFAEEAFNKVGKIDPKTGEMSDFPLPGLTGYTRPKRMNTDRDGNPWMGVYNASRLMKIDYRTGKFTLFTPPTPHAGPYSVSVDKTRNLIWFGEQMADQLARFDPSTSTFVEYPLPTFNSNIRRINVDPSRPNRVWYSGGGNSYDKVGYVEVLGY